jgi:hypothetical protein
MVKNVPSDWQEAIRVLDQNFRDLQNQVMLLQKKIKALEKK